MNVQGGIDIAKPNDIVRVVFDDHVQNGDKLMRFVVYGRLASQRGNKVVVEGWTFLRQKDRENLGHNITKWAIAKSCIVSMEKLYVKA